MKYIFLLSCLYSVTLFSQISVFNADFQQGLSLWTIINNDGHSANQEVNEFSAAWILKTDPIDQNDTVAAATSYFTSPDKADRWLISPVINLGAFGNIISWEAKSHDASFPDSYKVLILSSNTINSVIDTIELVYEENYLWEKHEINLSELGYNNQAIHVAFVLNTNDGYILYLDDVNVRKEDPVGINEISESNFSIYPNPVKNSFKINSEIKWTSIQIVDQLGKIVKNSNTNSEIVDVTAVESGIYFLHLNSKEGIFTQQIQISH